MCKYKMLYHSEKGYVSECPSCGQIQFAYGTAALNFEPKQYRSFYKLLLEKQEALKDEPDKNKKRITLSTEYSGFSLIYSIAELNELITILSMANFENEVQSLISGISR